MVPAAITDKNIIDKAVEFGALIVTNRWSTSRIMSICGVTAEEALVVRDWARLLEQGTETRYVTKRVRSGDVYILPETTHQIILDAYSDFDGKPATVADLELLTGYPRSVLAKYLKVHSITHSTLPIQNQVVLDNDVDAVTETLIAKKKKSINDNFKLKTLKTAEADARKWNDLEASIKTVVNNLVGPSGATSCQTRALTSVTPQDPFMFLVSVTDLHHNKQGNPEVVGADGEYNMDIAEERATTCLVQLLDKCIKMGRPERALLIVGSDMGHTDNIQGNTTAGTPQDTCVPYELSLGRQLKLTVELTEITRRYTDKTIVTVTPGNHDQAKSLMMMYYLEAWFRNCPDVTVEMSVSHARYIEYGNNLIGLEHGDGPKASDLPLLMAGDCPGAWGRCKNHMWFRGNFHHQDVKAFQGCTVYHLAALSGADRWHYKKGYRNARKMLEGFLIYRQAGMEDKLSVSLPHREHAVTVI